MNQNNGCCPIDQQLRRLSSVTIVEDDVDSDALEGFNVLGGTTLTNDFRYVRRGGGNSADALGNGAWAQALDHHAGNGGQLWHPTKFYKTSSPSPSSTLSHLLLDDSTIETASGFATNLSSSSSSQFDVHRQRRHQNRRLSSSTSSTSCSHERYSYYGNGSGLTSLDLSELSPNSLEHAKRLVLSAGAATTPSAASGVAAPSLL